MGSTKNDATEVDYLPISDNDPICSVCIPTFNGEKTIVEAVTSVLRQSLSNIEVVITDDNSSDQTLKLLRELTDSRLRIARGPASGNASDNWNYCVSLARGKYVKVMGQDDLLNENALEREVETLSQSNENDVVMTFCRRVIITSTGKCLPSLFTLRGKIPPVIEFREFLPKLVRSGRNILGEPVCATFRRDVFQRTSGFSGTYLIDLAMWSDLLQMGQGVYLDEVLCMFRVSRKSWTFQLRGSQAKQTVKYFVTLTTLNPGLVSRFDLLVCKVKAFLTQYLRHLFVVLAR